MNKTLCQNSDCNVNVSNKWKLRDEIFKKCLLFSGIIIVLIFIGIFLTLIINSMPSIQKFGLDFLTGTEWRPDSEDSSKSVLGMLPFLIGTLLTSFLALLISLPFSFAIAILLGEYFKKGFVSNFFKTTTELLAGIPSYCLWFLGLFYSQTNILADGKIAWR